MAVSYPPPPADRPQTRRCLVDRHKVLAICRAVEQFTPIGDAMRSQGIHETYQDWEQLANDGTDPFWAWAVSCLVLAEGSAIVEANSALGEKIREGDTRAISFFLSKRSNAYRDKREVEVKHSGGVAHLVVAKANEMLLSGDVSIADLANRRLESRAEMQPAIEIYEDDQEVHPLFTVKKPAQREDE